MASAIAPMVGAMLSLGVTADCTAIDYLEGGSRDIHEADMAFQRAVRDAYLQEAARDPHFLRIDCSAPDGSMLPPEAIFNLVRETVDPFLA